MPETAPHREGAGDRAQGPIEGKLPAGDVLVERPVGDLFVGRQERQRDRQVEADAHLSELSASGWSNSQAGIFKAEYRYRVKVEGLFSSIKTRFGGSIRGNGGNGAENEILLKCICHNIHVLLLR